MRTFIDFKLLLIVFVSFIFVNCDSEDVIDDIPNEAASENITGAPFGKYQQLNFEEALGYVNEIKPEKPSNEGDGLGTLNASSDFLVGVDANSLVFEDVENTAHKIPTLKARLKYPEVESTAFLIKVQDTVLGFLMNKVDDKSIDGEYFSGIIGITDLSGNFVNGYRLKNGEFISQFVIAKKQKAKDSIGTTQSSRSFTTRTAPIEDRWRSGTIMLDEVVVTERRRSRYGSGSKGLSFSRGSYSFGSSAGRFSIGGGGSGASGNNTRGEGSNGNTVRIFPCDDPLHGCKNNYVDNDEDNEDDKIINKLTGKAECVYDKLEELSGGFKNMIQKFDGDFPVSHLNFKINNDLSNGNYGRTHPPSNFNIIIEFSNTQLGNISDLGAAVVFAHEIIHAEIFRKMLSAAQLGNLNTDGWTIQQQIDYVNSLRNNFPGIYDYYIERYKPTWNHNMMASHYRDIIADIAQTFDNSFDRQVYEDVAWAGLRIINNPETEGSETSTAWDNLSSQEKSRVLSNISNYFHNGAKDCN